LAPGHDVRQVGKFEHDQKTPEPSLRVRFVTEPLPHEAGAGGLGRRTITATVEVETPVRRDAGLPYAERARRCIAAAARFLTSMEAQV
jgi:hypothetical protein